MVEKWLTTSRWRGEKYESLSGLARVGAVILSGWVSRDLHPQAMARDNR